MDHGLSPALLVSTRSIVRGRVAGVADDGYLLVTLTTPPMTQRCEVLNPAQMSSVPTVGTAVLVLVPEDLSEEIPIVLGQIGRLEPRDGKAAAQADSGSSCPDTLVLEAKQQLTLRVGDGSITIRQDGKILIRGKDLVSHATRLNRIKGGAVQIN